MSKDQISVEEVGVLFERVKGLIQRVRNGGEPAAVIALILSVVNAGIGVGLIDNEAVSAAMVFVSTLVGGGAIRQRVRPDRAVVKPEDLRELEPVEEAPPAEFALTKADLRRVGEAEQAARKAAGEKEVRKIDREKKARLKKKAEEQARLRRKERGESPRGDASKVRGQRDSKRGKSQQSRRRRRSA